MFHIYLCFFRELRCSVSGSIPYPPLSMPPPSTPFRGRFFLCSYQVIPAKAGIQPILGVFWIAAYAGVTSKRGVIGLISPFFKKPTPKSPPPPTSTAPLKAPLPPDHIYPGKIRKWWCFQNGRCIHAGGCASKCRLQACRVSSSGQSPSL